MEFTSILDWKESPYKDMAGQVFIRDLNLDQVIDRIAALWDRNVKKYYYYFPADGECEAYRREVLADVRRAPVYEALCAFVEKMQEWEEVRGKREKVHEQMQKSVWHIVETGCWCDALEELAEKLGKCELDSRGLAAFREYLWEYLDSGEYRGLRAEMGKLWSELAGFRLRLTCEEDKLTVSEVLPEERRGTANDSPQKGGADGLPGMPRGGQRGTYEEFVLKNFPGQKIEMKNPFAAETGLSILEYEVLRIFRKKHEDFFKAASAFYKAYEGYEREKLLVFVQEITFYLSFWCFEQEMRGKGCAFSTPAVCEKEEMWADGLYDLALACVNLSAQRKVVSNDMSFREGESFFVLTGPNQGGKTTFARSLGQLVYFAKMGLDVPALGAGVPHFTRILTHFSVEESVETGRGKLKEELVRLAPMMEEREGGSFVVINELFTTAANYDACIMGKKVLEHFIGQGCMGIYVTHLKELADAHLRVVSLRAMLDEHRVQNFKIMRSEAEESAYAINQVSKYRLTYEQLKERLPGSVPVFPRANEERLS